VRSWAIQRASLTDQAVDAIVGLIQRRNLADGDSLPTTGDLATMLNVSVPVVREAIAGLSTIGLVKRQQGKESVVSTPNASHLGMVLGFRIANANVDDRAIQDFREIVEVGNARLAAVHRDDAAIAELQAALTHEREVRSEDELHVADVAFHAAVAHAGGNDLSIMTLDALEPLLHRQRERVWSGWVAGGGDLETIIEAHAKIVDQILAQDSSGAADAMSAHLKQARTGLDYPPRTAAGSPAIGPIARPPEEWS